MGKEKSLIFADLRRNIVSCLVLYFSAAVVLLGIFIVAREADIPFYLLTKDPFAGSVDETPVYVSLLSNIGISVWCFTIAIQLFAAWLVRALQPSADEAYFLLWTGLITLVLMLDDFLMLHERMDQVVEAVIFGGYGVLVGTVLFRYRAVIFKTNYLVMVSALLCFMLSMVLDNVVERIGLNVPYRTALEDAFKMIGIFGWAYYFIGLSGRSVRSAIGK